MVPWTAAWLCRLHLVGLLLLAVVLSSEWRDAPAAVPVEGGRCVFFQCLPVRMLRHGRGRYHAHPGQVAEAPRRHVARGRRGTSHTRPRHRRRWQPQIRKVCDRLLQRRASGNCRSHAARGTTTAETKEHIQILQGREAHTPTEVTDVRHDRGPGFVGAGALRRRCDLAESIHKQAYLTERTRKA